MAEIKKKTLRLTTLAVLGALAIVLSALENLIPPLPMMPPGAKLGLSNIVTMFAAGTFGLIPSLAIALLKALFAGATRGVTALLMSLAGGLLSTLVMGLLFRLKRHAVSLLAVGILGAVATNSAVLSYLPFLLLYALVTGSVTGSALRILLPALKNVTRLGL